MIWIILFKNCNFFMNWYYHSYCLFNICIWLLPALSLWLSPSPSLSLARIHEHTHSHTHAHTHIHKQTHIHTHTHTHTCTLAHTCKNADTLDCTNAGSLRSCVLLFRISDVQIPGEVQDLSALHEKYIYSIKYQYDPQKCSYSTFCFSYARFLIRLLQLKSIIILPILLLYMHSYYLSILIDINPEGTCGMLSSIGLWLHL